VVKRAANLEDVWGGMKDSSSIFKLGSWYGWGAIFPLRLVYIHGKSAQFPFDGSLVGLYTSGEFPFAGIRVAILYVGTMLTCSVCLLQLYHGLESPAYWDWRFWDILLQLRLRQIDPSQSVYLHRNTEKYWNIFKVEASFEHALPVFARSVYL